MGLLFEEPLFTLFASDKSSGGEHSPDFSVRHVSNAPLYGIGLIIFFK